MSRFDVLQVPHDFTWAGHDTLANRDRLVATRPPPSLTDHAAGARNYRPDDGLVLAVNTAIHLRAPLLLTGDPGTGKTQLAWFLGLYFGLTVFAYTVRSTSIARDLHYDFDAVAHLREAYLTRTADASAPARPAAPDPALAPRPGTADEDPRMRHIRPGPLWLAYRHKEQCIVLIDEIDKAPRDFPNDLLQELDKQEFPHPFSNRAEDAIRAERARLPLVLVTSNNERRLPDAFLRRCVVHHIGLERGLIERAVAAHAEAFPQLAEPVRAAAITRFEELRREEGLSRQPGIAELLAWLVTLARAQPGLTRDAIEQPALADLPHLKECLVKDQADLAILQGLRRR